MQELQFCVCVCVFPSHEQQLWEKLEIIVLKILLPSHQNITQSTWELVLGCEGKNSKQNTIDLSEAKIFSLH